MVVAAPSSSLITLDRLASFATLWGELVDRTDIDDIVLRIVATYGFSLLAADDASKRVVSLRGLKRLIRNLHVVWQIQLLHLYSEPATWPLEDRLCLLGPQIAVQSVQFLVEATVKFFDQHLDDSKGKTKQGKANNVQENYDLLVSVYDSIFCALRLIWHSSFQIDESLIGSLKTALSSTKLTVLYNNIRRKQLGEERNKWQNDAPNGNAQGEYDDKYRKSQDYEQQEDSIALENDVLGFLRRACDAIANFHIEQAKSDPVTTTVYKFMIGLEVGRFAGANNPHDSQLIIEILTSLEGGATLRDVKTNPPNLVKYCQMYDVYMAIMGICVHHKARRGKASPPIDPQVLKFAAEALDSFTAVKSPSNIEKPISRLYNILYAHLSPGREPNISSDDCSLQDFDEGLAEVLGKRSRMLALSDPYYADFKREVSNIMETVSGSQGLLVPSVDNSVPFAVSGCRGAHIHSVSSRSYIDSTSSNAQKRCHMCTGDGANITGWREITQLSRIHAALVRLKSRLQGLAEERNKDLPESRPFTCGNIPGISGITTTTSPRDNGEGPSTPRYGTNHIQIKPNTRTTTTENTPYESPKIPYQYDRYDQSETIIRGIMPDTPPRSNNNSYPASPKDVAAAEHYANEPSPATSQRSQAVSWISSGFKAVSKLFRFTFSTKSKPSSVFAELLNDGSKKIHSSSTMSASGKQALLWTKSCVAAFSTELEPGQTSPLAFRHKFPGLSLDWDRPLVVLSQETFAAAIENTVSGAKIGVYNLASATRRKEVSINTYIHTMAISPDDQWIAVATKYRTIQLISTGNSQVIRTIQLQTLPAPQIYDDNPRFQRMSFCNSGKNLIVATYENVHSTQTSSQGDDCRLHIWIVSLHVGRAPTATLWQHFDAPSMSAPDNQGITTALYNPVLNLACITFWTSAADGLPIILHDSLSSPLRLQHPRLEPRIQAASFSPSGHILILITAKGHIFKVDLKNRYNISQITDESSRKSVRVAQADRPSDGVCLRVVEDGSSGGVKVVILSNDKKRSTKVFEIIKDIM